MQRDFLVFVWWYGLLAVFVPCLGRLCPWAKAKVKSWSRATAFSLFACCSLVTDRFSLLDARRCAGCRRCLAFCQVMSLRISCISFSKHDKVHAWIQHTGWWKIESSSSPMVVQRVFFDFFCRGFLSFLDQVPVCSYSSTRLTSICKAESLVSDVINIPKISSAGAACAKMQEWHVRRSVVQPMG